MGAESSNSDNVNNYIHPRLGKIVRLQEQQQKQFIEYTVLVEGAHIVEKWQEDIQNLNHETCKQFLFWPFQYKFEKVGMCGTGGNMVLKYGDFMFTLQPQIKNRMEIKRPFKEVQIWYMLYVLIKLQSIFEKQGVKIGDIRPKNILVNQEGQLQILSQYSWPGQSDNFKISLQDSDQKVYLAPEECKLRRIKREHNINLDVNKAEIFSIGLTILEACSLMNCEDLYTEKYHFNEFGLKEYTDIIDNKYSKVLIKIILSMLKISPNSRKSATQITDALIQHEQKLLGLTQLSVQEKESIDNCLFQEKIEIITPTKRFNENMVNTLPIKNNISLKKQNTNNNTLTPYPYQMLNSLPLQRTEYPPSINRSEERFSANSSFYSNYSQNNSFQRLNRPITKISFNPVSRNDY